MDDETVSADEGAPAERLNLFSDAVVAIAITLLALDLHVPQGSSNAEFWRDLARNADDYIAFLISFAVIGNYWFLHHHVFSRLRRLGGGLARWNMLWLLTIVVMPFATRMIVANGAFGARFAVYAAVQALSAGFFLLAVAAMDRHGLAGPGVDRGLFTRSYRRLAVIAGAFLVSIPFGFVSRWAYLCWVAIPVVSRVLEVAGSRRRARV